MMQHAHWTTLLLTLSLSAAQNSISSCNVDSSCVPIKSCAPIISQLSLAKETSDIDKKRKIIKEVREKVCGDRRDRLICCPEAAPSLSASAPVMIGSFKNFYHNIGGDVYALDSSNILIKGFTYDGEGPDAFFLAGTSGKPSRLHGDVVLPYPYEGEHYSYSDKTIPLLLRPFNGSEELVLTLPPGVSVSQLRWLSVWCRDYQINFGSLTFPRDLVL